MSEKLMTLVWLAAIVALLIVAAGFGVLVLIFWVAGSLERRNYVPAAILATGLIALVYRIVSTHQRHPGSRTQRMGH
jgi:tetrahydromethanopterin S-methyltransferase subunit C